MVSAVTSLDAQMFAVLRYAKASKRMPGVLFPVWCAKLGSIPPSKSARLGAFLFFSRSAEAGDTYF